jgi:hypothetical protein
MFFALSCRKQAAAGGLGVCDLHETPLPLQRGNAQAGRHHQLVKYYTFNPLRNS